MEGDIAASSQAVPSLNDQPILKITKNDHINSTNSHSSISNKIQDSAARTKSSQPVTRLSFQIPLPWKLKYICSYRNCETVVSSEKAIKKHMGDCHSNQPILYIAQIAEDCDLPKYLLPKSNDIEVPYIVRDNCDIDDIATMLVYMQGFSSNIFSNEDALQENLTIKKNEKKVQAENKELVVKHDWNISQMIKNHTLIKENVQKPVKIHVDNFPSEDADLQGGMLYQCLKCADFKSTVKVNMHKHLTDVHRIMQLRCNFCNFKTPKEESMTNHIAAVHQSETKVYACVYPGCTASSVSSVVAIQHYYDLHVGDSNSNTHINHSKPVKRPRIDFNVKKPTCDMYIEKPSSTDNHKGCYKLTFVKTTSIYVEKTVCSLCSKDDFSLESDIHFHLKSAHGILRYKCELCAQQIETKEDIANHITMQHQIQLLNPNKPISVSEQHNKHIKLQKITASIISCRKCHFSCDSAAKIDYHLRISHGLKRFRCKFCQLNLDGDDEMSEHMKNLHPRGFFKCSKCSYVASTVGSVSGHYSGNHVGLVNSNSCESRYKAAQLSDVMVDLHLACYDAH